MCAQETCDSLGKHKNNNGGCLAASAETKLKRGCLLKGRNGKLHGGERAAFVVPTDNLIATSWWRNSQDDRE